MEKRPIAELAKTYPIVISSILTSEQRPVASTASVDPGISVVIPAFNCEQHIREAIQTVIDQSCPGLEVIVVDDGSSDGTAGIVNGFADRWPIIYVRQDNLGPSAARNRGVSLARSDWIAFLDADDLWYPRKLEVHREFIADRPDVALFWSDMDYVDEGGAPRRPIEWNDPLAPIIFNRPVCPLPSSVIMRREVFKQAGGFNTTLRCYEDFEFFIRVAARFPICFVPRPLMKYRCHGSQLHIGLRCAMENWPLVSQSLLEIWRDNPAILAVLNDLSASIYTRLGKHLLRAGDFDKARYFHRMSFAHKRIYWRNLRRWALSYLPGIRMIYRHAKKHAIRT